MVFNYRVFVATGYHIHMVYINIIDITVYDIPMLRDAVRLITSNYLPVNQHRP